MPKCRVLKGGWFWGGELRNRGDILDAPSHEWIANRVADNGLVEPIDEVTEAPPASEAAVVEPSETATMPRPRGRR